VVGSPENAVLAATQFAVAVALFHFAIPSVIRDGRAKAFRMWALALSIALFGVDRFTAFMLGTPISTMSLFAHVSLVAYGALRFAAIASCGLTKWGETLDD